MAGALPGFEAVIIITSMTSSQASSRSLVLAMTICLLELSEAFTSKLVS